LSSQQEYSTLGQRFLKNGGEIIGSSNFIILLVLNMDRNESSH